VRNRVSLDVMILSLLDVQPTYGYDLGQALASLGYSIANYGPHYRMLKLLETQGLVAASWCIPEEAPDGSRLQPGNPRKVYCLTDLGRLHLKESGR